MILLTYIVNAVGPTSTGTSLGHKLRGLPLNLRPVWGGGGVYWCVFELKQPLGMTSIFVFSFVMK